MQWPILDRYGWQTILYDAGCVSLKQVRRMLLYYRRLGRLPLHGQEELLGPHGQGTDPTRLEAT